MSLEAKRDLFFVDFIDGKKQSSETTEKQDWQAELEAHVDKFNKTHASVVVGGKHRIMRNINPEATHNQQTGVEFYNRSDLSLLYANTEIKVGEKIISNKFVDILANYLMAWAKHPKARTYTGGVVFLPGRKAPSDYFKTWQGFGVKPKQNEALLKPIFYHMKMVLCNGKEDLFEYLKKWIAYTLQYPDKQAGSTIVARGEKGSGKGTLGYFLSNIWGKHALQINNAKHLIGNFNAHLADVCFLFADEAFYSGDKKHEGVLKGLVTERTFMVERKGIDAISQTNFLKIYMATNANFAVPASKDERRWCVLDVSSIHRGDRQYFNELYRVCDSKEVQSAFLCDMLKIDLSDWHTGDIPESIGLREQRYHSLDNAGKWLFNSLLRGTFGVCGASGNSNNWQESLTSDDIYLSYTNWCETAKTGEFRRLGEKEIWTYMGKIYKKERDASGLRGKKGYFLGSLENAISLFEAHEKVIIDEISG